MTPNEKIIQIITDQLKDCWKESTEINPESKIVDDLGADSVDELEIAMAIEEEFDVRIKDVDINRIVIVADWLEYAEEHNLTLGEK